MKIIKFRFDFHWNLFPGVQLTISQHGSGNGLAPKRRQAITWINADLGRWRIYATLWGGGGGWVDCNRSRMEHSTQNVIIILFYCRITFVFFLYGLYETVYFSFIKWSTVKYITKHRCLNITRIFFVNSLWLHVACAVHMFYGIPNPLQWRHNERDDVSNHQRLDCLLQWLVNSPHKGPVRRKMFPFDDVIMPSSGRFISTMIIL